MKRKRVVEGSGVSAYPQVTYLRRIGGALALLLLGACAPAGPPRSADGKPSASAAADLAPPPPAEPAVASAAPSASSPAAEQTAAPPKTGKLTIRNESREDIRLELMAGGAPVAGTFLVPAGKATTFDDVPLGVVSWQNPFTGQMQETTILADRPRVFLCEPYSARGEGWSCERASEDTGPAAAASPPSDTCPSAGDAIWLLRALRKALESKDVAFLKKNVVFPLKVDWGGESPGSQTLRTPEEALAKGRLHLMANVEFLQAGSSGDLMALRAGEDVCDQSSPAKSRIDWSKGPRPAVQCDGPTATATIKSSPCTQFMADYDVWKFQRDKKGLRLVGRSVIQITPK